MPKKLVDRDGIAPPSAGLQPAALLPKLPIRLVERVGVEPTKPLGRLVYSQGFSPVKASPKIGADGEHRTHNLLFTKQLLCQIELHQRNRRGRRARAQPSLSAAAFPHERLCPNVYTIHIVKERPTGA